MHRFLIIAALCLGWSTSALGLDYLTLRRDGREIQATGRVVLTAADGGILLLARDGALWLVQPEELVRHTSDDLPFQPMTADELARAILAELPEGFECHQTAHYLICHNTSRAYAYWCGSLFERLYMAFTNYWSRKGFDLKEPEFPLVAIVFADKKSYVDFAQAEVGDAAQSMIGYYSLQTNRMVMYDLTGVETSRWAGRGGTSEQINRILAQPQAARTVATVVHEATHQIAFNCGLHTRFSDCPLWFSEGIAIYFETPDVSSSKGWRTIGAIHRMRLLEFRQYLRHRPDDSLLTLISDDRRFRDPKQSLEAYAEAWALTYFLIRQYPRQYVEYLRRLSQKSPMVWDDASTRVAEFKQFFGDDLQKLDTEFVRYMLRLR